MSWIAARCGAATSLSAAASATVPSVMRSLSASRAGTVTTLTENANGPLIGPETAASTPPGPTGGASPAGAVRRRGHLIHVIAGKPRRGPFLQHDCDLAWPDRAAPDPWTGRSGTSGVVRNALGRLGAGFAASF